MFRCCVRVLLVLVTFASGAVAQTLAPNPDLDLRRNGRVNATVALPGGQFLVGGSFQRVSNFSRTSLARLNADGSFDLAFALDADGAVTKIVLSGGFAYVQGRFATVGGVARNGLARIVLATGQVDATWNAALLNRTALKDMAVDDAGNLFVVGAGMNVGGLTNVVSAKLLASTGLADPAFAAVFPATFSPELISIVPGPGGAVHVLARREDLGVPQNVRILKFNPANGATDAGWNPDLDTIDFTLAFGIVAAASGDLYVAGNNQRYSGSGPSLVRLAAATGAVPAEWIGAAGSAAATLAVVVEADGVYAVQSDLFFVNNRLAKYDPLTGVAVAGFNPEVLAGHDAIGASLLATPGAMYVSGEFSSYGATRIGSVAKVARATAALDPAFAPLIQRTGMVTSATRQADGRIVIGGNFNFIGATPVDNLLRLAGDGTLDGTWTGGVKGQVTHVKDVAGAVYVAGTFEYAGVSPRRFAARFDGATGAFLPAWAPVLDLRYQNITGDGTSVYLVGGFTTVNGAPRLCLAKLDATTGALDAGWAPPVIDNPFGTTCGNAIEQVGDKVYAGFITTTLPVNGQPRRLVRLNATNGAVDNAFDSGVSFSSVNRLFVRSGALYAAGSASAYAGVTTRVGRFDLATGAIDAGFRVSLPAGTSPSALLVNDEGVYVGLTSSGVNGAGESVVNYSVARRQLSNGASDDVFAPQFSSSTSFAGMGLATLANQRLLVGGAFETANAATRRAVAAFADQVAPGLVTAITVIAGNGQVTLTFSPPASDGGSPVSSYTATCAGQSATGSGTTLVVTGLANGVPVSCTVSAANAIGQGPVAIGNVVTPSAAILFRAYLSRNGLDSNPCTLAAPCRLLPAALAVTALGGEVWMLDSANFNSGTVTISKSVTILAVPGALGSIVANGASALVIQGSSFTEVTLRNLVVLNLAGTSNFGIQMLQGSQLTVEGCEIYGLAQGISVLAPGAVVNVKESTIRDNSQFGVALQGTVIAVLDRVDVLNSFVGVQASAGAQLQIRDSSLSGNTNAIQVSSPDIGRTSRMVLVNSLVSANNLGVQAATLAVGETLEFLLDDSIIVNNTAGVLISGPGTMTASTRGNNAFRFNGSDVVGGVLSLQAAK